MAEQAAEGNIAFSDVAATSELTEFAGLSPGQRHTITSAVRATAAEIERAGDDGSWSNNEMVDAVNEVCGSNLTPVTLTP